LPWLNKRRLQLQNSTAETKGHNAAGGENAPPLFACRSRREASACLIYGFAS